MSRGSWFFELAVPPFRCTKPYWPTPSFNLASHILRLDCHICCIRRRESFAYKQKRDSSNHIIRRQSASVHVRGFLNYWVRANLRASVRNCQYSNPKLHCMQIPSQCSFANRLKWTFINGLKKFCRFCKWFWFTKEKSSLVPPVQNLAWPQFWRRHSWPHVFWTSSKHVEQSAANHQ